MGLDSGKVTNMRAYILTDILALFVIWFLASTVAGDSAKMSCSKSKCSHYFLPLHDLWWWSSMLRYLIFRFLSFLSHNAQVTVV